MDKAAFTNPNGVFIENNEDMKPSFQNYYRLKSNTIQRQLP